ncbi:hypothetical protein CDEST_15620 [Colletotrichum destructivum]|uniref:Uncharacterized protein n=1 Tax=Colletotrichum destructivum TaxID=34406 RepID=A0AAX4J5C5_9PEZI|nr:hypothetical protein CDEST_15620 [Colletotrichum destructivum]
MSRFVSSYPVIRALLLRHRQHNLEYAAVAPFQTALNTLFQARDGYAVNIEQSVDKGRARVDLLIQGLDYDHFTLYMMMVGEMKPSYKSPEEGETQVLKRAREAIVGHGLERIYAFTTLGEGFRFWTVSARTMTLEPLGSDTPRGSHTAYIPLDSAEGDCIVEFSNYVKQNRPLREAPVLPSQDFSAAPEDFRGQASQANHQEEAASFMPNQNFPVSPQEYYDQGYPPPESSVQYETNNPVTSFADSQLQYDANPEDPQGQSMEIDDVLDDPEDEPTAGPSYVAGVSQEPNYIQVTITREVHTIRSDKYLFRKRKRGRLIITNNEDWEKKKVDGKEVWYFKEDSKYWGYKPR